MIRLTRSQIRELDRRAIQQLGIPGIVLMENAARAVADAASQMLPQPPTAPILILCGGCNNGGDGLAVARLLYNRGLPIQIALTIDPARYQGDALINYHITQNMHLPTEPALPHRIAQSTPPLIIDAIFGTGLTSPPRPPFPQLVQAIEQTHAPILSIDLPSGLDCDTGQPLETCIHATRTVTFVTEKQGFAHPSAHPYLGQLTIAEIGTPPELTTQCLHALLP